MRKVFIYMQMTYDGYLADKNNGLGWTVEPEMAGDAALVDSWDAAIIGYNGYKEMVAYWPRATENDAVSGTEKAFANKYNAMKKYVFSNKEHELTWNNCELVRASGDDSITKAITRLRRQPGKGIVVYGGVLIAQTLTRLNLIDEYMLVTHPVLLGSGRPLFEGAGQRHELDLVDVKHNKSGAVRIHYRRGE